MTTERLTHSRLSCMRRCPRQHYYRYELMLVRLAETIHLRIGTAFHLGCERHYGAGVEQQAAIDAATASYETRPEYVTAYDWEVERETVRHLLAGHFWRYADDDSEVLAAEVPFDMPLTNPETGAASRTWTLAGKIDAIIRRSARKAVREYKTCSEDIAPESDYWLRLRCDPQISQYVLGARAGGHAPDYVEYDVTRKPLIRPSQIPLLDAQGLKIVLDAQGLRVVNKDGKRRQSADAGQGYVLQTRPETPAEYGARLLADLTERPDWYYARREVPRLEDELDLYRAELWQQAGMLREAQLRGRWFRNVGRWTCPTCEYESICLNGVSVNAGDPAPAGYRFNEVQNPELGE